MHSDYKLTLDEDRQMFSERRGSLVMTAKMFSTIPMQFSQSNEWPLDPRTGFPEQSLENVPEKIWHFKAASKRKARQFRMATIMTVKRPGETVDTKIGRDGRELIVLSYQAPDAETTLKINLATNAANVVEIESKLRRGSIQSLVKSE
jgi:hypothetical protein